MWETLLAKGPPFPKAHKEIHVKNSYKLQCLGLPKVVDKEENKLNISDDKIQEKLIKRLEELVKMNSFYQLVFGMSCGRKSSTLTRLSED